jgi:hypothetical protein
MTPFHFELFQDITAAPTTRVSASSGPVPDGQLFVVEHISGYLVVGTADPVDQIWALVHHTLGNGEFDFFYHLATPVVCARAIITPENCAAETERLIAAALYQGRPAYMAFPADYVDRPVLGTATPLPPPQCDLSSIVGFSVYAAFAGFNCSDLLMGDCMRERWSSCLWL